MKSRISKLGLLALVSCFSFAAHAIADTPKAVNVPAGDLVPALEALEKQVAMELVFRSADLKGLKTDGVKGTFEPKEAIRALLKGTGLELREDRTGALLIAPPKAKSQSDLQEKAGQKGGGKNSSHDFRIRETNDGPRPEPLSPGEAHSFVQEEKSQTGPLLEEVVVTGSRMSVKSALEAPQPIRIYTSAQIERSGQTSVSDFLNTLPQVSVSVSQSGMQTFEGTTTVQLHGLPIGTVLVLINGRRTEVSGVTATGGSFFDLNNIPLAAIDRIEVLSEGSSAVYGSDAIAGVINIILKSDFDKVEADAGFGAAAGTSNTQASLAAGKQWDRGGVTAIASFQRQTELQGTERDITSNNDYSRFGGIDARTNTCNPGNVFTLDGSNLPGTSSPFAAVAQNASGNPRTAGFNGTPGAVNACSLTAQQSFIPESNREGLFISGHFGLTPAVELFAEFMVSHVRQNQEGAPPTLFGLPALGFAEFTVSPGNPYNPFGQTVGIAESLDALGRSAAPLDTLFIRPLAGVRGRFLDDWHWELAAWQSQDNSEAKTTNVLDFTAVQNALDSTDPATALNPFVAGAPAPEAVLRSLVGPDFDTKYTGKTLAVSGVIHGPVARLPAGPLQVAVGGEYDRDELDTDTIYLGVFQPPGTTEFVRKERSVFGEGRMPLLASHEDGGRDVLSVTVAGRYDRYSDFGSATTAQYGAQWSPLAGLLIRASDSEAFKAPSLFQLNQPTQAVVTEVVDPRNANQTEFVSTVFGGNRDLRPETGRSDVLGLFYSIPSVSGASVSVSYWRVKEMSSIQSLQAQVLVDNEAQFPGRIIRDASGIITEVDSTSINFGELDVRGFDYSLNYRHGSPAGDLTVSLNATETTHYRAALIPGSAPTDRLSVANDDTLFAPRWKAASTIGWKRRAADASLTARYIGSYQDYDSTRKIGDFWLIDANFRYAFGRALPGADRWWNGAYVSVGAVNLLNRLPQYSNFGFGTVGYDPAEADLRGRFVYGNVGVSF